MPGAISASVVVVTAQVPSGRLSSTPGCALRYCARSMRKSVRVRSAMETPVDRSSRSITASWSFKSCLRRYSRSFIGLPESCSIRFSSPVAEMSSSTMRPLTRCSRLMYSSSSMLGQKLTSWMRVVGRADAVDAAEALDDAHRVPVDVVVDQPVAVLEVLAFGDAVGGDEQVEFALVGVFLGPLLGPRGERGENRGQILAQAGERGLVAAGAGDQRRVDAEVCLRPRGKLLVEITGGVGEGGEDDHLAVAGVDRVAALVLDHLAQGRQLGVTGRIHLARRRVAASPGGCGPRSDPASSG